MTVPAADQLRLSHILADDLQIRIDWAYNLEQEIATLSGGGLTSWGLASTAQYVHTGDPNGLVTAVGQGDFLIDDTLGSPALWIAEGAGTVWTQASGGGGGAVSSVNSQTGAVVLTYTDVGADAAGAASTAQTNAEAYTDTQISGLSSTYQPLDSDLTAIAALSTTSYGRSLLTQANAGAARTTLGLGTAAVAATTDFDAAGAAASAQAASQPLDSDLTAIAALSTTSFGRGLLTLADAAAGRTALSLGTASLLADPITAAHGGTGLTSLTAHALQVGNGTGTVTQVGPDASSAKALFAAGSSADPAFRAVAESDVTNLTSDLALKAPLASPALTGIPTVPTATAGDSSTQAASTAFVGTAINNAITGLDVKPDVAYASTSALPANTYSNGTAGVGATLTGTANGPLIIDSVTILVAQAGERVLVAGEVAPANNGWYTITQVGVVAVSPYILTRATESDQAAEIGAGYLTGVVAPNTVTPGTSNNGKLFISVAADPFTVGTTSVTFSQVGGTYTNGNGIGLSGNTFSIDTSVTVDKTTAQTLTNKTLTSPVLNTGVSGTAVDTDATMAANSDMLLASQKAVKTALALKALPLAPTAVKTSAYNAAVQDFIPCDTNTTGSFVITLPTAPADKTQIGMKHIIQGGTNTVTVNTGGSDVFNKASGSTSLVCSILNESFVFQYKASGAIWYVVEHDSPKTAQYFEGLVALNPASMVALQTQAAVQAAQEAVHLVANGGYYVGVGLAITASATYGKVDQAIGIDIAASLSFPVAAVAAKPALATANATTVGAGSNGVHTNTFVGSQTLTVAATAGFAASGVLLVYHSAATVDVISYGAIGSGTTFTNCTRLTPVGTNANGSGDITLATGDIVVGANCDATNPRWAVVELDAAGVLQLNLGTAAAVPTIPTYVTARTPLALIYIPANTTGIDLLTGTVNNNAKIIDIREIAPTVLPDGWTVEPNTFASPNTTVASGSNTVVTNTFAGTGVLNVASTTGFPTAGILAVTHSGTVSLVCYTGTTSTTFTGCYLNGVSVTLATSDVVRYFGFSIASATDFSGRYRRCTKVKWSESTTIKYAAVGVASFASSVTYIPFIATEDYVPTAVPDVASTFFSYQASPQGFPTEFNWTSVLVGWSSNPTSNVYRWSPLAEGKLLTRWRHGSTGTSSATAHTGQIPQQMATISGDFAGTTALMTDNSTVQVGTIVIASAGLSASLNGIAATSANTIAAGSRVNFAELIYPI